MGRCVLLPILLFSLSSLTSLAGEKVYTFNDMKAWDVITGKWDVKNAELYLTEHSDAHWCDTVLLKAEEEIRTEDLEYISAKGYDHGTGNSRNVFIIFGYTEGEWYYVAGSAIKRSLWCFRSITEAHATGKELAVAPGELTAEEWYQIKVVFEDDTATIYGGRMGEELAERLSYTFPEGMPEGRVGLGAASSMPKYDDFTVAGSGINALVQPRDKVSTLWGRIKNAE